MKGFKIEYFLILLITIISVSIAVLYDKLTIEIEKNVLWILVGLFFSIVIYVIIRNFCRKEADPYELINPLLIIFTLYSMMLPLNCLINWEYFQYGMILNYNTNSVIFQYIIICLIGLIGLLIGYYSPFAKQAVSRLPVLTITNRELKIIGLLLFMYGMFSFATNVASFGGITNYIKVGYGGQRAVIGQEALAFGSGIELLGISTAILMFVTIKTKKKVIFFLLFLFFLWFISVVLLTGQRRYIIYVLLIAFVIFNYGIFRVKLKWALIMGLLFYLFFFTYAYTRFLWVKIGIIKGITETFNFVVNHPTLLLPFAGGEFIPPAEALTEVLSDNAFHFKYGLSYLVALVRILPRMERLWPEALQRLATWRLDMYYPGLKETGSGFAFFTVAEGFVNFGHLGVLLHMFIYGFIARLIFLYYRQNSTKISTLLIYAVIFPLMLFEGIRGESGQILWNASHTYVGPLLLIIIFLKISTHAVSRIKHENST